MTARPSRFDGLTAACLAILVTAAAGLGLCAHARRVAERYVRAATPADVPFKFQTLTLQRAALANGRVLPIYGSSELFCCGSPFRPTQLFSDARHGFKALALGKPGMSNLFFLETFAALGNRLRGRKVVVSASPAWFFQRRGIAPDTYRSTFLAEVAYAFAFDGGVPRDVRALGARRMLAYPAPLADEPLLRLALEDLAHPTPLRRAEYAALVPLGRLAGRMLAVRDALRTELLLWSRRAAPAAPLAPGAWTDLAKAGTSMAVRRDTTNPFGFTDRMYRAFHNDARVRNALARYRAGTSNRDGQALPAPTRWLTNMSRSTEWRDLRLALRLLHELDARPLVWSLPLPGIYDNYTPRSAAARRRYYDRWEHTVEQARVPWLDFRTHDEDPWFLVDPGSHFSSRGWAFADRALDLFWHGGSGQDIGAEMAALDRAVPPPAPPLQLADAQGDGR